MARVTRRTRLLLVAAVVIGVGFVGTVVQHHELGPVALGLVKRQVPDDAPVRAASGEGDAVVELPVTLEAVPEG